MSSMSSTRPPASQRGFLLLLGVICIALVAGAVALQELAGQYPCPWCIILRYLFLITALLAFIGAALSGWGPRLAIGVLILLTALGGAATAGRLAYLEAHPSFSCGIDVMQLWTDSIPLAQWWPMVFQATGMCGTAYPSMLGLSLAQWALVAFIMIIVGSLVGLWKMRSIRGASLKMSIAER